MEKEQIRKQGFYMPGEYGRHHGTIMIWPKRPGSWKKDPSRVRRIFADMITEIAEAERVYLVIKTEDLFDAHRLISEVCDEKIRGGRLQASRFQIINNIKYLDWDTDDAWARDTAPTFLVNDKNIAGVCWKFNAWGGAVDGLYTDYENDARLAANICEDLGIVSVDAGDFVLEGGAIHSDGEGTVLVTEACLLSKGRNPQLDKEEITERLLSFLGAEKIIWLKNGIYNDETNEHVDNVCAFVKPGKVLLAWTEDEQDPQYAFSKSCLDILERERDAKGRAFEIIKLPIPKVPVCVREEDLEGFVFEEGEDTREIGERLAASYINFYVCNGKLLLPLFGDEHDVQAIHILHACFPERRIVPIQARELLLGGGNIHCLTQQIPEYKSKFFDEEASEQV